ncbi:MULTISPECIES: penicillin acylase family protein [unclassified Leifsonia]|uniref:penicillin acylase family protein n=1 Tax=unclassified Leifsonia TaxID=2663824 RepID=UPI000B07238B|nr:MULTISPECIES: penicillin acylase family protein [unclassified Leifsonia]
MGTDSPRTSRHRGTKVVIGVLVSVLVLAVIAAGVGVWTVTRSFPTMSGRVDLSGLHRDVTVYRDSAGIPQIAAETAPDLFMAQGYVSAQDRFWEMDFRRHVTSGRLSELFGESQVPTDTFIRTLGWRAVAEKEVELLDETTLSYYQAYADGVNAYLKSHSGADISLEYAVLGLQNPGYTPYKWTVADSLAWLKAMAWDLRSNLEDEIDRALLSTALSPDEVKQLHPEYPYDTHPTIVGGAVAAPASLSSTPLSNTPLSDEATTDAATAAAPALRQLQSTLAALPELIGPAGNEIGSNSWVAAGALTDTEAPILANDPHLGAVMPSVWYQVGLRCVEVTAECPFAVAGYSFSGVPGVIIGHNDTVAWGFTNLGPDVADLYLEKVSGDEYELDGAQVGLRSHTETITVAGGDPVDIEIRATERGPIITGITDAFGTIAADYPASADVPAGDYQLSLQWTALTPGRTASSIFALDKARNWNDFRAAAAVFDVPSQNLLYADVDGNIGYQAPGLIPVRKAGDGTLPLPGWTSANGWNGYIPFGSLPSLLNPASGLIVTANNAAVGPDYPSLVTKDWDLGYRAQQITTRLQDVIAAKKKISVKTMASIQADTVDLNAVALAPVIAKLKLSGDAKKGAALLEDWDHRDDADSAAAAYFNMTWRHLLAAMFDDKLPEGTKPAGGDRWFGVVGSLLDEPDSPWWTNEKLGIEGRDAMLAYAAEKAYDEGVDAMGSDPKRWTWGSLHTLELTHASFGESGIAPIEWLFNRGPYPVGGSSSVVNAVGWDATESSYDVHWVPSMRQVISLADFNDSTWINLTGASGHAFHPNYDDQTPLWQTNRTRPWKFTPTAVEKSAKDTLVLKAEQ